VTLITHNYTQRLPTRPQNTQIIKKCNK